MKLARRKTLAALTGLWLCLVPAVPAEVWRNHFDADGQSRPPAFFDLVVLGLPGKAAWIVVADHNPPSAPNQLTQAVSKRPEGSIAAAIRRNVSLEDGKLNVSLKKLASREGLVFRMADEKNFLVLLIDGASGDARLRAYRDGAPVEVARATAPSDREWGILTVSLEGPTIAASWNQKELFRATDPKPVSGRVGVATEGPGIASFDEFVIDTGAAVAKPAQ